MGRTPSETAAQKPARCFAQKLYRPTLGQYKPHKTLGKQPMSRFHRENPDLPIQHDAFEGVQLMQSIRFKTSKPEFDFTNKFLRATAEFKETLLRSLLPHHMEDTEAGEFLKANNVQFLEFPDGREELHGFGTKLGDVFCGIESHEPQNGINFVTRFTPVPG